MVDLETDRRKRKPDETTTEYDKPDQLHHFLFTTMQLSNPRANKYGDK
jgi:hypothetical protein